MTDKYLGIGTNGLPTEVTATVTSAGAGDAGKIVALAADGKLDATVLPAGVGQNVSSIIASEALSAGDWVNVYNNAGTASVRKADNSNGRRAHGFVLVAVASAASASVYGPGEVNSSASGMTIGAEQFLGTAGSETGTVPTASGAIVQGLGVAISAAAVRFVPTIPMVRA